MRTPQLADNLRRAVLQAAIAGKLNDRTNENARDLLAAIQREKAAQQETGKQKKNKPLASISEEEIPFAIPENWVWVRLGDIGETNIGLTYDKKDISDNGTIVLRSGNIQNDKIDLSDVVRISSDIVQSKMCRKGDILICARNGSKSLVGKAAIINEEGFSFGAFMAIFRSSFNPYIFYYLHSPLFRSAFDGVGTTTINQITQDNLRNRLIPLPPLTEQQQIVAKLNRLLAEIDELKAQEQALLAAQNAFPKKLRAAILQAAIQGELNERTDENARDLLATIQTEKAALQRTGKLKKDKPLAAINEEEIPFAIPKNWVWVRLGDILFQLTDGTHSTPKYVEQGIPFLSVKNISSGKISFQDTKFISEDEHLELTKRCKPEKGDILLSKVGTTGIPVLIEDEVEFSIFVSVALLKFPNNLINSKFLLNIIQSPFVQEQAQGNTRGVGNKNWVLTSIANTLIPLPPLTEQQQIVAKLEALLAEIDTLENAA